MQAHSCVQHMWTGVQSQVLLRGTLVARLYTQGQRHSVILEKPKDSPVIKEHLDHIRKCPLAQVQTQPPQSSTPTAQGLFNKVYKATQARSPGAGDTVKPEMTGIQQGTENGNVMYSTASTKQHINIHSYNNYFI